MRGRLIIRAEERKRERRGKYLILKNGSLVIRLKDNVFFCLGSQNLLGVFRKKLEEHCHTSKVMNKTICCACLSKNPFVLYFLYNCKKAIPVSCDFYEVNIIRFILLVIFKNEHWSYWTKPYYFYNASYDKPFEWLINSTRQINPGLLSMRSSWWSLHRICPSYTLLQCVFSRTVLITNCIIHSITDLVPTLASRSITLKKDVKNDSVWNCIKRAEHIESSRTNLTPEMNQTHGVKTDGMDMIWTIWPFAGTHVHYLPVICVCLGSSHFSISKQRKRIMAWIKALLSVTVSAELSEGFRCKPNIIRNIYDANIQYFPWFSHINMGINVPF